MTVLRILVSGSRDYDDVQRIREVFEKVMQKFECDEYVLISGHARGADTIAEIVAEELGWQVEVFPAEWSKYGKRAGGMRNQKMVDSGADICVAFPLGTSVGTWDCVRRAKAAGIPTRTF